ncbi:MAG TPA: hypothetical protein VN361_07995 [Oxalicibacterium sp.]|nr:hypothetical protein [Oxalicibacterium sp.]
MSTVMDNIFFASNLTTDSYAVNNREGDWNSYLHQIAARRAPADLSDDADELIDYKRRCALAYLGKRAQLHGGVYSRTRPRILTPETITELRESNLAKRYARYPWLEKLLALMSEIERIQDQACLSNVFSLVPPADTADEPSTSYRLGLTEGNRGSNAFRPAPV